MSIKLDFVKQLTTTKAVKDEENSINKKQIKESFNSLIDSAFLFGKSRPAIEKLQDKVELKFSYICLLKILEDYSDDYEVDKSDVRSKAKQIYESAFSYKDVLRRKNKSKCSYINPYQNLLVGNSASKVEISRGYERQLLVLSKMFDLELNKIIIDPREIIESYSTYLLQKQSFELLENPIEKRIIDEEILLNFNPNQEKLYSSNIISKISYHSEEDNDIYKMINRFNDVIMFQKIGTLEYEKSNFSNSFYLRDGSTLQNYRIRKEYNSFSNYDYDNQTIAKEYNIFTNLNIYQLTSDPEFTLLHADILFSDLNLKESIIHNGGYIGEIVKNDNGKYDIFHDHDKLCACIDFKKN